jgi:hypothetical protein
MTDLGWRSRLARTALADSTSSPAARATWLRARRTRRHPRRRETVGSADPVVRRPRSGVMDLAAAAGRPAWPLVMAGAVAGLTWAAACAAG